MDLRGSGVNFSLGDLPAADKHLKIKVLGIMLKYTTVRPICFTSVGSVLCNWAERERAKCCTELLVSR